MMRPVKERPAPRVYEEVVDGEVFHLQEVEQEDPEIWDLKHYEIRRGGEKVLEVQARGHSYYWLYWPDDPYGAHIGHVQNSRRGTLLAAALLLTRGLTPPKPELGEENLRKLVATPRKARAGRSPSSKAARP